jgi:NAD(P)-dependent dehydrogenase (short-subunit alcohol dehydrogenase family)
MPLLDAHIGEVKRVYETNVVGIILAVQAFAPLLIAAGGTIINIGSIAGVAPVPWQSVYNSSKAAVNHLTDTLRLEMEPLGVKVILVSALFPPVSNPYLPTFPSCQNLSIVVGTENCRP